MTLLFTAIAVAAAQPATTPAPAAPMQGMSAQHAQHAQHGAADAKLAGDGCSCCKKMAGDGKMACCAKHGEPGAKPSGHSTNH